MRMHLTAGGSLVAIAALGGCVAISGADALGISSDKQTTTGDDAGGGPVDGSPSQTIVTSTPDGGAPPPPPVRPPAGSWLYDVSGGDELKGTFPFPRKAYGPTATIKVDHTTTDCFRQTITLREDYDEVLDECIAGIEVVHKGGSRSQKFPFVGQVDTAITCAPGDVYFSTLLPAGKTWNHSCTGSNDDDKSGQTSTFITAGAYRFVAIENITIKSKAVPVAHFRNERVVSGSQTGSHVIDWYFAVASGIVVRMIRQTNISYAWQLGSVNYLEDASMTLRDPPR